VSGPNRFESLAGFDVELVTKLDDTGPFDVVLDGVGGQVLMDAIHRLAPGGVVVAYGVASGETTSFAFRDFPWGKVNWLTGFYLWATPEESFGQDLTYLAALSGKDLLDVRSSVRWDWSRTVEAVEMLRGGEATGKVILTIA